MAFDYTGIAATAARLITRFGQAHTLRKLSAATSDPVAGTYSAGTPTDSQLVAIEQKIKNEWIDGDLVRAGDRIYVSDNSQTPEMGDQWKVGSEYWNIVNVKTVKPAATTLVFFVQIRK